MRSQISRLRRVAGATNFRFQMILPLLVLLLGIASYSYADLTHTIKKGDTLSKIAKRNKVSINEIRAMNNLKKSAKLKPGRILIVKKTGPKSYTVKKGDSIYRIAKRFNIDADLLKDINELDTEKLKTGQKLFLEPKPESKPERETEVTQIKNLTEEIKKISESEEILNMNMSDRLILFAKKFLDIPYKFGGNTIMGIDCSAYVQKVYGLIGMDLPRSARLQFDKGESIEKEDLSIGDLVFFKTYASFPSHVGIYLGNDLFIHASSKGKKVSINSLNTPYYLKRFIGAKRFITEKTEKAVEDQPNES